MLGNLFPTAIPADTGKAAVLNSYVSCPVRLTRKLAEISTGEGGY